MSIFTDEDADSARANFARVNPIREEDLAPSVAWGAVKGVLDIPSALYKRATYGEAQLLHSFGKPWAEGIDSITGTDYSTRSLDALRGYAKDWAKTAIPRPWELGPVGMGLHSLGVGGTEMIGATIAGTALSRGSVPVGLAAGAAYNEWVGGLNHSLELQQQGVDELTADRAAFAGYSIGSMGVLSPTAVAPYVFGFTPYGRWARIAAEFIGGGLVNQGFGVVQRVAEQQQLVKGGYEELAREIKPYGLAELLVDGLIGGVMQAATAGHSPAIVGVGRTLPGTAGVDAVFGTHNAGHSAIDTRPGRPAGPADAEAHVEALIAATEQLARGETVNVDNIIGRARFETDRGPGDPRGPPGAGGTDWNAAARHADTEEQLAEVHRAYLAEEEAARAARLGISQEALDALDAPPEPPRELPKTQRAETYADKARREFLALVKKNGGIDAAEARDITGERGFRAGVGRATGVFRKGGRQLDHHAEWMHEQGYLTDEEFNDPTGSSSQRVRDLVGAAINGETVMTPAQRDEYAMRQSRDTGIAQERNAAEQRRAAIVERQREREANGLTDEDLQRAHFDELPPAVQDHFDQWADHAREIADAQSEIKRVLEADGANVSGANEGAGAGRAEATAGGAAGGESLQNLAREPAAGDGTTAARELKPEPYTRDIFGESMPPVESAPADLPEGQREPMVELYPGVYGVRVGRERVSTLTTNTTDIRHARDIAVLTAHLQRFPQENMVMVMVDRDGHPIGLLRHAIGGRGTVIAETATLAGFALRDKRVAEIWISHNHPSVRGEAESRRPQADLSPEDETISEMMNRLMLRTRIRYRGLMAVGNDKFTLHDGVAKRPILDIGPELGRDTVQLPVYERVYDQNKPLEGADSITNSTIGVAQAARFSQGENGTMLLNGQNVPVGFVKEGASHEDLLMGAEATNAASFAPVEHGGAGFGGFGDAMREKIARLGALAKDAGMRVLDAYAFTDKGSATAKDLGILSQGEPKPTKPEDELLKPYTSAELEAREQERLAAAGVDAAQVAAAKKKAEADAQRDTFALAGSDREADKPGQGQLFQKDEEYQSGAVPMWQSALREAVMGPKVPWNKRGEISGDQLLAWLDARVKDGMFKKEELEATGLREYVAMMAAGRGEKAASGVPLDSISRKELEQFLDEYGVKFNESVLGNPSRAVQQAYRLAGQLQSSTFQKMRLAIEAEGGNVVGEHNATELGLAVVRGLDPRGEFMDRLNQMFKPETVDAILAWSRASDRELELERQLTTSEGKPQYSSYQIEPKQLESYKELLFNLPMRESAEARVLQGDLDELNLERQVLADQLDVIRDKPHATDADYAQREDEFMEVQQKLSLLNRKRNELARALDEAHRNAEQDRFTSGHFSGADLSQNLLAHTRFNERVDANGKRILFVEEIQSDWAQQGRDLGFRDPKTRQARLDAALKEDGDAVENFHNAEDLANAVGMRIDVRRNGISARSVDDNVELLENRVVKLADGTYRVTSWLTSEEEAARAYHGGHPTPEAAWQHYAGHGEQRPMTQEQFEVFSNAEHAYDRSLRAAREVDELQQADRSGVPLAPFMQNTKSWVALMMKRLIRYAADNGFDGVAWTTGKQQNDRYPSLAQEVRRIEWVDTSSYSSGAAGQKRVSVETTRGQSVVFNVDKDGRVSVQNYGIPRAGEFDGQPLSQMVGRELAQRIMSEEYGNASGDGLSIGGHGMVEFYETIVPSVARDVLKKLGGGKVVDVPVQFNTTGKTTGETYYRGPEMSRNEMLAFAEHYAREGEQHLGPNGAPSAVIYDQLIGVAHDLNEGMDWQRAADRNLSIYAAKMIGGEMMDVHEVPKPDMQPGFYLEGDTAKRAKGPMTLFQKPEEYSYKDYPGTPQNPVPREAVIAAGEARTAEAEKAEQAVGAAVNCALTMGG